jgi:predicted TIM-barrel fold metal-dependent hydrolase
MILGKYKAYDAHCHIFPEKIAARAVQGTDDFYGEHSVGDGTVNGLITEGVAAGIDRFIVQSVATTPHQVRSINRFIAESVAAHPDRLTGLGALHPRSEDIAGDVEDILSLGLHGVKMHPDIQGFAADDPGYLEIYKQCEKAGLPVLLHTGDRRYDMSNPNRILPLLEKYPALTFIGAHYGGWSIWEDAVKVYKGIPNFYVDCSSSLPYLSKESALAITREYGADHVMFGTDFPMWGPKSEIETVLSLGLTDDELTQIFSLTAEKVFGITQ